MKKYFGTTIESKTYADGRTYYTARFRVYEENGELRHKRIGGKAMNCTTEKLAYKAYIEYMKTYVPPTKCLKSNVNMTFNQAVVAYLRYCASHNSDVTVYDKRSIFSMHITPFFDGLDISKITKAKALAFQDSLWEQNLSYKYKTKIRGFLHSMFVWADERELCTNPLKGIKLPPNIVGKRKMLFWEENTFKRFISVVDNDMWRAFFNLLFYGGLRVGEVCALSEDKIKNKKVLVENTITRKSTDNTTWKVKPTTKNKKSRSVPLTPTTASAISAWIAEKRKLGLSSTFLFGLSSDKPLSENTYQRAFSAYCAKANVERIRIHDLRHSYVSWLIHNGISVHICAALIGDTIAQVNQTYGHLWQSDFESVISGIKQGTF